MSARDDYPYNGGNPNEWERQTLTMCAEIDSLRAELAECVEYSAAVSAGLSAANAKLRPPPTVTALHMRHWQSCGCLGDTAECCVPTCPCHVEVTA